MSMAPRGLLSDRSIRELCVFPEDLKETFPEAFAKFKPMISPYLPKSVNKVEYKPTNGEDGERAERKIISAGQSSYGYDIRLAKEGLKIFTNTHCVVSDPKEVDSRIYDENVKIHYDELKGWYVLLPGNTGLLGHTMEYFNMPRNIFTQCQSKSTYARLFVAVIVTPLEPEWEGTLVVEIANLTSVPARVYLEEGIAQINFFENERCEISYADRGGKYQGQTGTQDAKV